MVGFYKGIGLFIYNMILVRLRTFFFVRNILERHIFDEIENMFFEYNGCILTSYTSWGTSHEMKALARERTSMLFPLSSEAVAD